jgi:hypothetical protein
MTIAELHGKLNPDRPSTAHERMEDLLTSDVFGTMNYVGWEYGFVDWLRSASSRDGKSCVGNMLPVNDLILGAQFLFWPRLKNGCEPDLLIGIETKTGDLFLLMIEAKYLSGASDFEMDFENSRPERSGNQIADQVNSFPDSFSNLKRKVVKKIHLYVTAHDSCPSEIYDRCTNHIIKKDIPLFWLNWQSLSAFLEKIHIEDQGRQTMINDLVKLLHRKNLVPFQGFKINLFRDWPKFVGQSFWHPQKWWSSSLPKIPLPIGYFRENS